MLDFDVYFSSLYNSQVQKHKNTELFPISNKPEENARDEHIISILDYSSGQRYTFLSKQEQSEEK